MHFVSEHIELIGFLNLNTDLTRNVVGRYLIAECLPLSVDLIPVCCDWGWSE